MSYKAGIFARIDEVVSSVEAIDDWVPARSSEATYMYQLRAAQNMNVFEPFTPEQNSLNAYLSARYADLKLCDYAWRLYAHSRRDDKPKN